MIDELPICAVCLFRLIVRFPAGIVVNVIDSVRVAKVTFVMLVDPLLLMVTSGGALPPIENTVPAATSICSFEVQYGLL